LIRVPDDPENQRSLPREPSTIIVLLTVAVLTPSRSRAASAFAAPVADT
jgi:hypothetical protein